MLTFTLLGSAEISRDDPPQPIQLRSQTEKALLIYLAHAGQTHSREVVADMLWDARTTQQALSNLRTALARIKKRVGDVLVSTRKEVAYAPEARQLVDSVRLIETLGRFPVVQSTADAAALRDALNCYQGLFLHGFYLRDAPRFNEWVVIEQERINRLLFAAWEQLLEFAIQNSDRKLGIETASNWLRYDAYNEATHRRLLRLLVEDGQSKRAIELHQKFELLFENDLAIPPEAETLALVEEIKTGHFDIGVVTHKQILPGQIGALFGRKPETDSLIQSLRNKTHPLISIVGMGGIGKTRLATTLAERLQTKYQQDVWYVPLADIEASAPALDSAVASTFNLKVSNTVNMRDQLCAWLSDRETLLVLDNCEHLLEISAELVETLIAAAPGLTILVTSREPLGFHYEFVFRLEGLSYPSTVEQLASQADAFPAVSLFANRARLSADWSQDQEARQAIYKICSCLVGSPLAIELAATWTREMSLIQVAEAVEQNIDMLESKLRGFDARHRSIRAVFEGSWSLLSGPLQQGLARLTVFRGGWTVEAAAQVTAIDKRLLADLFEKSLLWRDDRWRYEMHALIESYSAEKQTSLISADAQGALQDAHANWYLSSLAQATDDLRSSQLVQHHQAWNHELANVQAAWEWAIKQGQWQLLAAAADGLVALMLLRGTYVQGESLFSSAIGLLAVETDAVALAQLLVSYAPLQAALGHYQAAIRDLEAVRSVLENMKGQEPLVAAVSVELGMLLLYGQIDLKKAQLFLREGFSAEFPARLRARANLFFGLCTTRIGQFDDNASYYHTALTLYRQLDDRDGEVNTLQSMGFDASRQRQSQMALELYEQAQLIADQFGMRSVRAVIAGQLSSVYGNMHDYTMERRWLIEAIELNQQLGQRHDLATAYNNLGINDTDLGDYVNGLKHYQLSIRMARELNVNSLAWYLNNLGLLHEHQGHYALAADTHREAMALAVASGSKTAEGIAHNRMAQAFCGMQQYEQALAEIDLAAHIQLASGQKGRLTDTYSTSLEIALAQGNREKIEGLVEPIHAYLESYGGSSLREPIRAYLNCYRGLFVLDDARAPQLLVVALATLEQQAQKISDPKRRKMYLENIPAHRQLLAMSRNDFQKMPG